MVNRKVMIFNFLVWREILNYLCRLCDYSVTLTVESLRRVQDMTKKKVHFHELDLLDKTGLQALFKKVRTD